MKKFFIFTFVTALFLNIGPGNVRAVRASSKCTNAMVTGKFGSQFSGTIVAGGVFPAGPIAATGFFYTDGEGNLNGSDTVSFNGTIVKRTVSGTYNVKEDCTLTATFTDNLGNTQTLSGIIVKDGKEILSIETDPYTVNSGIQKKVE